MRRGITPKCGISALMAHLQELLTSNTHRELLLLRSGSIQYCVPEDPRDIDDGGDSRLDYESPGMAGCWKRSPAFGPRQMKKGS
ncbi:hypothetical protein N7536_004032 [Penicillium majusculum]|nr:hypothetical protein N7536_004032 [Penicillium majusculum]